MTRSGQGADQQGLKADRPVALYGALRKWPRWPACCASRASSSCSSCRAGRRPREYPSPLAAAGLSALAGGSAGRQAGRRRPKGDWKVFEVDWGAPKAYLLSHILGPVTSTPTAWEAEPLWNKVSDEARFQALLLENGIRHDTTVILYGRNTMAAARAAHLMMYAGVEDVRLLDGGLDAWFVQHLRTETGLANTFAGQGVRRRHSGPSRVLTPP